jgi:hypothetical protein
MAEKIMEYLLLYGTPTHELTKDVNAMLKEGWSLYGSPMCWGAAEYEDDRAEWMVYQAMVKYQTT